MKGWHDKLAGLDAVWQFDNRWELIGNRLLNRNAPLLYQINGVEFLVDHQAGDSSGTRLCITTDLYKRFLPYMDLGRSVTLFDLGANGGGFPLVLLVTGINLSKVVAVEMNPNTFRRLEYNLRRNIDGQLSLVAGAVCGQTRRFDLSLGKGSTSDSIYAGKPAPSADSNYSIQGYTFDELYRTHFGSAEVDICKMDIEGAEYEVIESAECTELSRCRYLVIEIHGASTEKQLGLIRRLKLMGFSEVQIGSNDEGTSAEHLFCNDSLRRVSAQ